MNHTAPIVFCFVVLLLTAPAKAQKVIGTNSGGQECHPVNIRQAEAFEWRENGFWNVDQDYAYWVICPLKRPVLYTKLGEAVVKPCSGIAVTNLSAVDASLTCYFREVDSGGSLISSYSVGSTLFPQDTAGFGCAWSGFYGGFGGDPPKDLFNSYNVACLLPPGTGITGLQDWWSVLPQE